MERAAVSLSATPSAVFQDGLGERRLVVDPTGRDTLEWLCIRTDLASVPSFEFALRERVSRLAAFRHPSYARIRSVERLNDPDATLTLVSERVEGARLSHVLSKVESVGLSLDINSALCLVRQLVAAVSALHETGREAAHGALGPERLIVTADGRVMVAEYACGSALEQLRFSQDRCWSELRVALPRSAGQARFDQRADVLQVGITALSLVLGRLVHEEEFPSRLGEVLASTWAVSARGGFEPLPPGLRGWLGRALHLDPRNAFTTAIEAGEELEKILGDGDRLASPASLDAFLAKYQQEAGPIAATASAPNAAPTPHVAPAHVAPAPLAPPPSKPVVVAEPARPAPIAQHAPLPAPPPLFDIKPLSAASVAAAPAASPHSVIPPAAVPTVAPPAPPLAAPSVCVAPVMAAASSSAPATSSIAGSVAATPSPAGLNITSSPFETTKSALDSTRRAAPIVAATPAADEPIVAAVANSFHAAEQERDEWREAFAPQPEAAKPWGKIAAIAGAVVVLAMGGFVAKRMFTSAPPAVHTGTLVVTSNPSGAATIVDGEARGMTPITLTLSAGQHEVELRSSGGAPRTMSVSVGAGSQTTQYIELPKTGPTLGQLQVRTDPPGAEVTVDGVPRGRAPALVTELAAGEHTVQVSSDLGSMRQTVSIEAGATASLVVPLGSAEGAPLSGWISIAAPLELQVFEHDRLLGTSQTDRIMVAAGKHDLDLANDALGFRVTRTVQVAAGKTFAIKIDLPKGTIALNATPWAEVWIDGEKAGETPLGNVSLSIGSHDIVFRHPDLGEQHHTAIVTLKEPARLSVDMRKK